MSMKFVLKDPINNIPALFQMMVLCCQGDKALYEPMIAQFSAWNDRSPTRSIRPDFELNYLRIAVSHLNL